MKLTRRLEKAVVPYDRSSLHVPLNDPLYLQLRNLPENFVLRAFKGLFLSFFKKGYDLYTNERIVEIPFVYQNFDLPQKAKVLDFGCCESKVSIELASLGYDVTGVDLNDYPFSHPNFRFVKGNFLENALEGESFDAIVAISAVEHCGLNESYGSKEFLDGDKRIMDEFYRLLKKEGKLFVTVPYGKRAMILGPYGQRVYDEHTLTDLLDRFQIIKEEYYIGMARKYWKPAAKDALSNAGSGPDSPFQGVACVAGRKLVV